METAARSPSDDPVASRLERIVPDRSTAIQTVFDDPNRFDVARQPSAEHLAFSGGIHYCLGSPLARMELAQAFRALAERFPAIRMTEPLTMRPGTTLRGPLRFPVAVG